MNAFKKANTDVLLALGRLGHTETLEEETFLQIEQFGCQVYSPKSHVKSVSELRWLMFKKNQSTSDHLPPTLDSLRQGILRDNYQCMIWANNIVANPNLPPPSNHGWWCDNRWCEVDDETPCSGRCATFC